MKLVAGLLALTALLLVLRQFQIQDRLKSWLRGIEALGVWGAFLFVLIYIAACVLFIPGSWLTLGAGIVFGVGRGVILVSIASTLGATAAFLVGRYLARDWVARKIQTNPRFRALDEAIGREGWKIVGLTRLSPVFPFTLLNYAFGLTRVSLRDYFLASWIGMLPGTVLYVYAGALLGDLGRLNNAERAKSPAEWAVYVGGLLATVAVTIYVTRLARRALARQTKAQIPGQP